MNVVVIGGGAAGFFAAIACAEANPACRVTILERGPQVLAKVRISGGGRCNITHACFEPAELVTAYPRGAQALRGPFSRFQPRDTVAWFESRGVALKTERDGRMFPITDDSRTIVDCLTAAAQAAGVIVRVNIKISAVRRASTGFCVELAPAETLYADRILLATGSDPRGMSWARELGHHTASPAPSLFTFNIDDPHVHALAGSSVNDVLISLPADKLSQRGPILLTHWGLSGPAVLKLSAWAARALQSTAYKAVLHINWLTALHETALSERLAALKHERSGQLVGTHSPFGALSNRLWGWLCHTADIHAEQRWAKLPKLNTQKLAAQLLRGQFQISGKGVFKEEFVTCGGVDLGEINFRTMESRVCPGLHIAGEALDIDGITGGFNFQSAWTTGWLAGNAIARSQLSSAQIDP